MWTQQSELHSWLHFLFFAYRYVFCVAIRLDVVKLCSSHNNRNPAALPPTATVSVYGLSNPSTYLCVDILCDAYIYEGKKQQMTKWNNHSAIIVKFESELSLWVYNATQVNMHYIKKKNHSSAMRINVGPALVQFFFSSENQIIRSHIHKCEQSMKKLFLGNSKRNNPSPIRIFKSHNSNQFKQLHNFQCGLVSILEAFIFISLRRMFLWMRNMLPPFI